MVKPKLFISYRRAEPGDYAGQIYRWARDRFGRESVEMDEVTLEPGEDWLDAITRAVSESRVLLVVIGPQWERLAKTEEGEEDYVGLEVQIALDRPQEISVIPLLVGGATMPRPSQLPPKLRELTRKHALQVDNRHWDYDIEQLERQLEQRGFRELEGAPARAPPPPDGTSPSPSLGALVFQGVLLAFAAGLLGNWLVTELMPTPDEQDTEGAAIAVSITRRTVAWAVVGVALGLWLALNQSLGFDAASRAIVGLLLGALAGAAGGTVDALPAITNEELGSWVDPVALGATGAFVGALLGAAWRPSQITYGLAAGAAAGALVQLVLSSPSNPGEAAVRVTLITGLVLLVLAGVAQTRIAASASSTS
jgi:hypothetical protein